MILNDEKNEPDFNSVPNFSVICPFGGIEGVVDKSPERDERNSGKA